MIENPYKSIHKENLFKATEKLKRVLHPTITRETWDDSEVIELVTDITSMTQYPISFYVKCLNRIDQNTKKTIFAQGFVVNNTGECSLVNMGSSKIEEIASRVDDVIKIALVPETGTILKTEAEVFIAGTDENPDNKNHIISINYIYKDEFSGQFQTVEGDADVNFHYTIDTGRGNVYIENGVNRVDPINTIHHSIDAQELIHDIPLVIEGFDENHNLILSTESGYDSLETRIDSQNTIRVNIDAQGISQSVEQEVLANFPVASDSQIGGIKTNSTGDGLGNKQFPVLLDTEDHLAYVDLTNLDIPTADVHRYDLNNVDPHNRVKLVQHIGDNSSLYITGYYYKWAPDRLDYNIESGDGWFENGHQDTQEKLLQFNIDYDYILSDSVDLEINLKNKLEEGDPILADTVFVITQGDWFEEDITYQDLNELGFMLKDNPDYRHYSESLDYLLSIKLTFGNHSWKQKNVQPMIKVGSPLVFKGSCTWADLQIKAATADPGDFYIVTDKSNQEYYWTGTEWEFMGQIIDIPEYTGGNGIDVTNHVVSVKYDNSTIKKNGSGNLYVDGLLTDTQADWNESDTTSPAYINNKPYVTVAQVLTKLNEPEQQV